MGESRMRGRLKTRSARPELAVRETNNIFVNWSRVNMSTFTTAIIRNIVRPRSARVFQA